MSLQTVSAIGGRDVDLRYFEPIEFREWWPDMSLRLLFLLDAFRHQWGAACRISPHHAALGRRYGSDTTQHNIELYGEVRAADFFPEGITTRQRAWDAVNLAQRVGFTGIGVYPDWQLERGGAKVFGMHADVRVDRSLSDPALWGGVDNDQGKQVYVDIDVAIQRLRRRGT